MSSLDDRPPPHPLHTVSSSCCCSSCSSLGDDSYDDDINDYDECAVRIRYDEKGPFKEGWDRKIYNRPKADELELQRFRQRAFPDWVAALLEAAHHQRGPRVKSDVSSGYSGLVDSMLQEIRTDVSGTSPFGERCQVSAAPVSPEVVARFMANYERLAAQGVRPRILYHGTQPQNFDSICSKGLLPPPKLNPGISHYTDAIWTAPDARTSVSYCGGGNRMFGCAVLDDKVVDVAKLDAVSQDALSEEEDGKAPDAPVGSHVEGRGKSSKESSKRREKPCGRPQHRQTRKATPSTVTKKSSMAVSYVGDFAVLVRDEALICPCVELEWDHAAPSSVPSRQVPARNQNTLLEDHALRTLSTAYRNDTMYCRKTTLRVARRSAHRARDLERRQLRTAKASF